MTSNLILEGIDQTCLSRQLLYMQLKKVSVSSKAEIWRNCKAKYEEDKYGQR